MKIKRRIIQFLIENKEKGYSINELAETLKIDYKLAHTNISKLQKEKFLDIGIVGHTKQCFFNN